MTAGSELWGLGLTGFAGLGGVCRVVVPGNIQI